MKRTQTQRVLDALQKAGDRGLTRVDFLSPTCDGKAPIVNFPGRIHDVQHKLGVPVEVCGERHGCHVYRLGRVQLPYATGCLCLACGARGQSAFPCGECGDGPLVRLIVGEAA